MKTCALCGKEFPEDQVRPDDLPFGLGFLTEDGVIVDVCTECLIKIGKEKEKENEDEDFEEVLKGEN